MVALTRLGIVAVAVGLASAGTAAEAACDCEPVVSPQEYIDAADVIFRGKLTNLSEDFEGCGVDGTWNHAFKVREVYKGQLDQRVNVRSAPPGADSCTIPGEIDGEFLVDTTNRAAALWERYRRRVRLAFTGFGLRTLPISGLVSQHRAVIYLINGINYYRWLIITYHYWPSALPRT